MIDSISGKLHRLKNNSNLAILTDDSIDLGKDIILMTGENFGNESDINTIEKDLIKDKIRCLIVSSINRRVYRYLINIGVPVVISPEAYSHFRGGEKVEIHLPEGKIISKKTAVNFSPYSEELLGIIDAGGLIPYTKININR